MSAADPEEKRRKNYMLRRSIMDYGMGLVILCFGIFFAIADRIGYAFDLEPLFRYGLSGLFIIYGAFRIYRGYQQNYYSEE
ncbi:MAG: hypothetical protein H7Y03_14195 [Chitinophagaceae bacterium]|nr:hypothetical protein [Chitinophagaceae bacterium]